MEENNKKLSRGSFLSGMLIGITISLLISSGVYMVKWLQDRKLTGSIQQAEIQKTETSVVNQNTLKKMEVIEDIIQANYYKEDIDREAMADNIYKGMVKSLEDPYSVYYTQEEKQKVMEESAGAYVGIGAYVSMDKDTGLAKLSGIIEGTPAEEAELRAGDLIYKVDDKSTEGEELTEVVKRIKGKEGTTVHLTLIRENEKDYLEKDLVRSSVKANTVRHEMLEDHIGYIQILEFDDVTTDQFAEAMAVLKESGMTSLILDLRGNPGGNLGTVVDIAGMLLPKGLVVYTQDRNGNRKEYFSDGKREIQIPMVVLVNEYSASASEILAGSIQDYGKGTLLGTTTYGKGIVQQLLSLTDGSAVKLTISTYYTPKGRNIHGIGIEPDIVCELDKEGYYSEEQYDNQLEEAKKVLQK